MTVETDVFRNMKVIMFVSQIWGLVPRTTGGKPKKFVLFVYSLLATAFYGYVCVTFNLCALERIKQAAENVKLLIKIIYVETTLRCILLVAMLLINLAKSKEFMRILEKLADFDALLKRKLHAEIPTRRNFLLQIAYAGYILFFGIYYCAQLWVAKNGLKLSVQWAVLSNINLIIMSQFTIFIHAFNVRFKIFNTFFMNMNVFSSFNGVKLKNYFDYSSINAPRYRNLNILSHTKLKELHIIYLTMRDLLQEINSYYSFQVLLIVCETVAIFIASISTFTFNITADDSVTKAAHRNLTLIHCGLRLLSIALLIHAAEETSSEVSCTISSVASRIHPYFSELVRVQAMPKPGKKLIYSFEGLRAEKFCPLPPTHLACVGLP